MNLHTAGHRRGVVAAPHHAAAEAGRLMLAEGGNALEAMVAMAATIAAAYPHMNHIGGDAFWLIREPSGRVRALMGAGPAGAKATPALYREHGLDAIPPRGPLAALTVPGAVATWMLALRAAEAYRGRLPLDVLFGPAIRHAREGYTVTRSQVRLTAEKLAECRDAPGFAQTFLIDGKPPTEGATLKQAALAATLDQLANAGLGDFYRGDVGREIAADLERIGSPVTRADLERYEAKVAEPLSIGLEAGTLYNTPPPTQGLASLIILALFERLRVTRPRASITCTGSSRRPSARFWCATAWSPIRSGSRSRWRAISTKPSSMPRRLRSTAARPPSGPRRLARGDTIWMGAADSSGLVVSFIQSLYWEFGSGCVLPATGVLMQNRGASFSLERGALNFLQPGRQPFHTLNPALAVLRDGRVMAYGAMGGDGQPQTQAALFSRHVLYREPLEEAIDRPRWLLGRTWGSPHTNLRLESRFDEGLIDRLMAAGHDVEVLAEAYSDTMGHAGAVVLHPDGSLEGVHDPRADGGAAGV